MPQICYVEKTFRPKSMVLIEQINSIIYKNQKQGYSLTLRQIYYQLVAGGIIPNTEKSYNSIGTLVSDARLAGLIDWASVFDRTRAIQNFSHWESPEEIIKASAEQYRIDLWSTQPTYVEVWVEKDALSDVVGQASRKWDVPFFACRGYVSQSALWAASQRIAQRSERREGVILYLGDHDPSGIDMTRGIEDRMRLFECEVEVQRIALNYDQVQKYNPPTNPAKLTDSRCEGYINRFGQYSWELDALPPSVIDQLITSKIEDLCDIDLLDEQKEEQEKGRKQLYSFARWSKLQGKEE